MTGGSLKCRRFRTVGVEVGGLRGGGGVRKGLGLVKRLWLLIYFSDLFDSLEDRPFDLQCKKGEKLMGYKIPICRPICWDFRWGDGWVVLGIN